MSKATAPDTPEIIELRKQLAEARAAKTPESMDEAKRLWAALDAAVVALRGKPKVAGYASRAGKRQTAERRAMHMRRGR